MSGYQEKFTYLLIAGALGCVLPFLIMALVSRRAESIPFEARKVESQDWILVVMVVTYFVPVVTRTDNFEAMVSILLIAAILLSAIEALPCHPLLHALRYRFYKVEASNGMIYTVITKRTILTAADIKSVKQISATMLMEG